VVRTTLLAYALGMYATHLIPRNRLLAVEAFPALLPPRKGIAPGVISGTTGPTVIEVDGPAFNIRVINWVHAPGIEGVVAGDRFCEEPRRGSPALGLFGQRNKCLSDSTLPQCASAHWGVASFG
jgi:hypothetical protein